MTDKTDIAALRPSERAKLGFVTDDNTGGYYVAECEECGQIFPSQNAEGGGPIADSGDYDDCYCPHCGHVDPEECDNANLVWNVQQLKIVNLTKRLEEERQQREAAEAELAALRGEQEPDGYIFCHPTGKQFWSIVSETCAGDEGVRPYYFTRQPKPVVVLPKLHFGVVQDGHAVMIPYSGGHWLNKTAMIETLEAAGVVVKDGE